MNAFAPRTRESLSVVVASTGDHFQSKETMQLPAATIASGASAAEGHLAAYTYLGDILVRFVFTAKGGTDVPMRLEDMKRLELNPARTLVLATVNFKRTHGVPQASPIADNVYALRAANPDAARCARVAPRDCVHRRLCIIMRMHIPRGSSAQ